MTSFSTTVHAVSLISLSLLLAYTLWLMCSGRLSAHVIVRWVLAELTAIIAIALWGWLPVSAITSSLGDRELLVILAVIAFSLVAFLMLDSLAHISAHTRKITVLTQELSLLRAHIEKEKGSCKDIASVELGSQ